MDTFFSSFHFLWVAEGGLFCSCEALSWKFTNVHPTSTVLITGVQSIIPLQWLDGFEPGTVLDTSRLSFKIVKPDTSCIDSSKI
jgi:hypothetical protein